MQDPDCGHGANYVVIGVLAVVLAIYGLTGGVKHWPTMKLVTAVGGMALLSAGGVVRHFNLLGDGGAKGSILVGWAFLVLGLHIAIWPGATNSSVAL